MDTQNKVCINIEDLSFSINKKKILENISLKIYQGDMVSIIGPNGSGKSTLISLISGEIIPVSGSIKINEKFIKDWKINSLSQIRSVLKQSNILSFPFKVLDIVKMGRFPFSEINDKINEDICKQLINKFDLDNYKERNYLTLSGGEKQRVQLARVLAQIWSSNELHKKILMLDEPTSFLDIKHQYELFDFLRELNSKGLTIIMVLHDLNQVINISKKIIMLKKSKLVKYINIEKGIDSNDFQKVFDIKIDLYFDEARNEKIFFFKNKESLNG